MQQNNQHNNEQGAALPLIEEFYTIQGEGHHAGRAAFFIRLGGCDIGCDYCDTKFSWMPDMHQLTPIDDIVEKVKLTGADTVVVTGGEPLSYNLNILCSIFKASDYQLHLETSGAYPLSGVWDWICVSPKINQKPQELLLARANELKVIIRDEKDFEWAELNREKVGNECLLFLQPEWSRYKKIIPVIIDYVKNNTHWQISLQVHKFMHIP